jgi:hypothetical protein
MSADMTGGSHPTSRFHHGRARSAASASSRSATALLRKKAGRCHIRRGLNGRPDFDLHQGGICPAM